jgi:HK97 family phage major capsid protein
MAPQTAETEVKSLGDLKKYIGDHITEVTSKAVSEQLEKFKTDTLAAEIKKIYPTREGDLANGSEGTNCFGTSYNMAGVGGLKDLSAMSAQKVAERFCSQGGFFRALSPAMKMFAESIRCKGRNFDFKTLVDLCNKQVEVLYTKAATGMGESNVGYAIPIEFPAIVIEAAVAASPILSKLWRFPMTENQVSFPKWSQSDDDYFGGVTMTWSGAATSGEGNGMIGTKPTTDKNLFTAKKVTAMTILTDELIQDSPMNILNYITGLLVRKFQYEMERVVIKGNGTTEPTGIITDHTIITNALARTTNGTVKWQDIVKLDGKLNEIFTNAYMITRKATLSTVRSQVDDQNRPIWFESWGNVNGVPTRVSEICGLPYHVTRNCPEMGKRGDIIIGDLSMYMLGMRADMRIDISDAPGFKENETYVRFISRMDGMPGTSFAFKMLEGAKS